MRGDADIAAAGALLAERARAELVLAVVADGRLSASELAARAGIARSTASGHLRRLVDGGFLVVTDQGRNRYYELAGAGVAEAVEGLSRIAPERPVRSLKEATRGELLREARTCYDHLAGRLGVALARALEQRRVVVRSNGGYELGEAAAPELERLGIDLDGLAQLRRPLVRGCLDWSERELHVAGAVGAAITARLFELGCLERRDRTRSVAVTDAGRVVFDELGVKRV
ncbi:MAG TPA: helix-turn-helix domain-containing protein [Gaiellaceae bacterium]|nr:helix-turn-helix domain-containing protein [Gaiellaceae bacterium]